MPRQERFTYLLSNSERKQLASLAERLQRTQGDVLRLLVREKERELDAATLGQVQR